MLKQVSDIVAVACCAAADAGIRSVCVTNFSWDFIYAEYVMAAGHHRHSIVWQIEEDYSHCEFLFRLPGYCPRGGTNPARRYINSIESEVDGVKLLEAEASLDYLSNFSPHRFEALYGKTIPESIVGEEFIKKYGGHNDPVTVIDPKRMYFVRAPACHPIYENFQVKAFKALLTATASDGQLTSLGALLYQCHCSYSACGLGSDGTARLVQLVQEMQRSNASNSKLEDGTLHGTKIAGGGSGGTANKFLRFKQRYRNATGYSPLITEGSSPGAGKFGHVRIRSGSVSLTPNQ